MTEAQTPENFKSVTPRSNRNTPLQTVAELHINSVTNAGRYDYLLLRKSDGQPVFMCAFPMTQPDPFDSSKAHYVWMAINRSSMKGTNRQQETVFRNKNAGIMQILCTPSTPAVAATETTAAVLSHKNIYNAVFAHVQVTTLQHLPVNSAKWSTVPNDQRPFTIFKAAYDQLLQSPVYAEASGEDQALAIAKLYDQYSTNVNKFIEAGILGVSQLYNAYPDKISIACVPTLAKDSKNPFVNLKEFIQKGAGISDCPVFIQVNGSVTTIMDDVHPFSPIKTGHKAYAAGRVEEDGKRMIATKLAVTTDMFGIDSIIAVSVRDSNMPSIDKLSGEKTTRSESFMKLRPASINVSSGTIVPFTNNATGATVFSVVMDQYRVETERAEINVLSDDVLDDFSYDLPEMVMDQNVEFTSSVAISSDATAEVKVKGKAQKAEPLPTETEATAKY